MSDRDRDDYEIDPPGGDEFDGLLAAMQTYHDPEQLKEFATRIPELIYAVRRARQQLDDVMRAGDLEHARNVALLERAEQAEAQAAVIAERLHEVAAFLGPPEDHPADDSGMRELAERVQAVLADGLGTALLIQQTRAESIATAAAIVLHELEHDGQIQPHTRSLLAAALTAYEAGKAGPV